MNYSMENDVAIVTGGSRGIGRATAIQFATEGAAVVVADVARAAGEETVDRIESTGGEAMFVETDVSEAAAVENMVSTAVDTYGGLDYTHNNAGIEIAGSLTEQPESEWDEVTDVNLKSVWLCLKHAVEAMVDDGGGSIVNTSSVSGLSGSGGAPYTASKHGAVGLTRSTAVEYGGSGIRVNAVCPGAIDTKMFRETVVEQGEDLDFLDAEDELLAGYPMGRTGKPEEVANAVVWLCSDEASFVNGHPLAVDGGRMAR